MPLFGYNNSVAICKFPILSNTFDCNVSHVDDINKFYIQNCQYVTQLEKLLTDLYDFYEENCT